ncbi:transcriptional regulator, partial [Streptomyces sp. NPDC052101]
AGLADDGMRALQTAKGMAKDRTRDRVELMITSAELARLRGDSAGHAGFARRAALSAQHLASRRLATRLKRLAAGQPLEGF